jgi:hypothetical protein
MRGNPVSVYAIAAVVVRTLLGGTAFASAAAQWYYITLQRVGHWQLSGLTQRSAPLRALRHLAKDSHL